MGGEDLLQGKGGMGEEDTRMHSSGHLESRDEEWDYTVRIVGGPSRRGRDVVAWRKKKGEEGKPKKKGVWRVRPELLTGMGLVRKKNNLLKGTQMGSGAR